MKIKSTVEKADEIFEVDHFKIAFAFAIAMLLTKIFEGFVDGFYVTGTN
jgi:hypothetical protein